MMHDWQNRLAALQGYGIALIGVVVMTIVLGVIPALLRINNISTFYLLVILLVASIYGRGPAILASVFAFFMFDWFFTQPLHMITVTDPAEWIALVTFLATALITGQLTATVRARAEEAQRRATENQILYELSGSISAAIKPDAILPLIAQRVVDVFALRACTIFVLSEDALLAEATYAGEPLPQVLRPMPAIATAALQQRTALRTDELGVHRAEENWATRPGMIYLPLLAGVQGVGVVAITRGQQQALLVPGQEHLLMTFSHQVALAIERIRLERESTRTEILARTDELRAALLNSVSHDLRTPLAAILTSATSLLQTDVEWDAASRHDFLITIRDEAQRLNRLVGNLLDMSRIEAGALQPEKDWYMITEVINAVLERYRSVETRHPIKFEVNPDLPLAWFDYVEISQVLANLVENAIKYTPEGTPITIRVWIEGQQVRVSVHDQGPGIPASEQAHIFDKFYRVQRQDHQTRGTGLGLAIARGFIEAHGGRLWVDSDAGTGTTFTFTLPLAPVPVPAALGQQEAS